MDDFDEANPLPANDGQPGGGNTLALFLGLYLLILAFFILLVSISSLEEVKSKAVMDSLTSSFSSMLTPTTDLTDFTSKEGEFIAGQEFQEQVTGIFATAIQVARIEIVHPGRLMKVTLPADALFNDDETSIRQSQVPLLDRIVASLSGRPPGLRYDMEFVISVPYARDQALPVAQTLPMRRAGAFAREMASRGVPPDSIVVGMMPGDGRDVAAWFYVRGVDETVLRFEEPKAAPVDSAPAPATAPAPAAAGAALR